MTLKTIGDDARAETAVRKTIVVNAPAPHAFNVFTNRMVEWWPQSHHIGSTNPEAIVIEPEVDGRWFERGLDGVECQWGKVLVWSPPHKLVLAWQLNGDWAYDPNFLTEVELQFISEGPERTRVELEHRNLDRYGDRASKLAAALSSPNGWGGILDRFHLIASGLELPPENS